MTAREPSNRVPDTWPPLPCGFIELKTFGAGTGSRSDINLQSRLMARPRCDKARWHQRPEIKEMSPQTGGRVQTKPAPVLM